MSRVPLNHGNVPLFVRSRIFFTLQRRPDVNANHPIERNYGNSVRFFAKIPNGTAAESPCYSVFWNAIDFCRQYTSKKISMWALPTVPLFAGKSRFFTRNVHLKTFSRLASLFSTANLEHAFTRSFYMSMPPYSAPYTNLHFPSVNQTKKVTYPRLRFVPCSCDGAVEEFVKINIVVLGQGFTHTLLYFVSNLNQPHHTVQL